MKHIEEHSFFYETKYKITRNFGSKSEKKSHIILKWGIGFKINQ